MLKKPKIKFIREYNSYGRKCFDVVYGSWRVQTFSQEDLPSTIRAFLSTAKPQNQYDRVFKREEIIYTDSE